MNYFTLNIAMSYIVDLLICWVNFAVKLVCWKYFYRYRHFRKVWGFHTNLRIYLNY